MLHLENSEAFVRHHSEQLACGNMRGSDNGRPNFLPEKCHIAGISEWKNRTLLQSAPRSVVLQTCTLTSGLLLAGGLLFSQCLKIRRQSSSSFCCNSTDFERDFICAEVTHR